MTDRPREPRATLALPGRWGKRQTGDGAAGSVWPNPLQVLLLKACLLAGEQATEAWDQWLARVGLESVDASSAQLLGLAYRNLDRLGVRDDSLGKLKQHYMVMWGKNQRTFRQLSETLDLLHAHEIDTLVLKGAALTPLYYRDEGVRGMGDFDVLVPEDQFDRAAMALVDKGWRPLYFDPRHFDPRFEHAIAFLDAKGSSVDLHCHVLIESCERRADDLFWEASRPLTILGSHTRTLCTTDHLIQACAHGLVWVKSPPVRWVADAVTILGAAEDEIDWDRVVRLSRARGVGFKVAVTLEYLGETFDAETPPEVVRDLRMGSESRRERRRHEMWIESQRGRPGSLFLYHWSMYRRGVRGEGTVRRLASIPEYLRFWAQTDRLWRIPMNLAAKGLRVIGSRLGVYQYWDGT